MLASAAKVKICQDVGQAMCRAVAEVESPLVSNQHPFHFL